MIYAIHFFTIWFKLESPLSIGTGEKAQVVRGENEVPYVPATSMAGILRHSMPEEAARALFGYVSTERGNRESAVQSRIFVSNGEFNKDIEIIYRDGVALDEYHTAIPSKKYLLQAVGRGAVFNMRFELEFESKEQEDRLLSPFLQALSRIQSGEITLGAKQTRGFGKLSIKCCKAKRYARDGKAGSTLADSLDHNPKACEEDFSLPKPDCAAETVWDNAVRLYGTLCVREYADIRDENDVHYSQMLSGGLPVIPATSWAGAFRRAAFHTLCLLGADKETAGTMCDELFGPDAAKNTVRRSLIRFEETLLTRRQEKESSKKQGTVFLRPDIRTAINRVSGGASNSALYKEAYLVSDYGEYGGRLVIRLSPESLQWAAELMNLLLLELNDGRIHLGGGGAVGRGIFRIDGWENKDKKTVQAENLLKRISEGGKAHEDL